tara:strand:- start:390 stop:1055 length:666 start_codon:yes stop_codon:yes gene_type:complete
MNVKSLIIVTFFVLFSCNSVFAEKIRFKFSEKSLGNYVYKDLTEGGFFNFFNSSSSGDDFIKNFSPMLGGKNLVISSNNNFIGFGIEEAIPLTDKTSIEIQWKIRELFLEHDERLSKRDFPVMIILKNKAQDLTINYVWSSNFNEGEFWYDGDNTVYVALDGKNTNSSKASKNKIKPNDDFEVFFWETHVNQIDEIFVAVDTNDFGLESNAIIQKLIVEYM